jgi:hypothetical protein
MPHASELGILLLCLTLACAAIGITHSARHLLHARPDPPPLLHARPDPPPLLHARPDPPPLLVPVLIVMTAIAIASIALIVRAFAVNL